MKVNEIATKVGVTPDTVRFYTRVGLLNPIKNQDNGYKNYGMADQKRLVFIVKSRHLGFSVNEIKEVIGMSTEGNSPCRRVRTIVKNRLNEALGTIDELQQLAERMQKAVDAWAELPDGQPTGDSVCSLIEMWDDIELGQLTVKNFSEATS
jgi:DNA-binding transcriptional MerR regulator